MKKPWNDELQAILNNQYDSKQVKEIQNKYQHITDSSYQEKHEPQFAANDIHKIETMDKTLNITANLYEDNDQKRVRIYQANQNIVLSDILPVLDNFGIKTLHEERETIRINDDMTINIIDLSINYHNESAYSIADVKHTFENALIQVIANGGENDAFNKLVIAANIDIEAINIVRSYAKYMKQIKYRYSQSYIEKTVISHVEITRQLLKLFDVCHNPQTHNAEYEEFISQEIISKLDQVKNIDDDNIIRRLMLLIKSTLRTNYYQKDNNGNKKPYITLKIDSQNIPDMPLPKPLIDTFVYSSLFEGIHLRSHKVSRGGIRWSDRHDDYRTEVLGLMKAQKVKNSIIIPSGAKGGFVLKEKALAHEPNTKKCIINCYQQFIRGLLDVTDNIKNDIVVHPTNTVCRDENDTYFVVAADKGTADLSDYANSISKEYQFWLGDAFASGGSNGYDHKKLGITAKGAWKSLERNLQELNRLTDEFTMVGIGDMSGDVFGNGLIQSNKIRLLAAFDHRHIFLDPNPNCDLSFQERIRLFQLPSSSWDDYNREIISEGGGVYKRSEKLIVITPQIKQALAIEDDKLTPDQLIRAILKSPVDVLYNGGIGTYVKASRETSENLGDKYNEFCRVNGNELRCKIVCEGGNLGFTQLARVEYALNGGLINTDFIDNSAGVDCSDHEVNIKILLNQSAENGSLDNEKRSQLLASMEQDICKLVLKDNYAQALVMSYTSFHAKSYFDLYHQQIRILEEHAGLDRAIEFLPSEEDLSNRKANGKSLTKPELAVLLAYTKIYIKDEILKSDLPDKPFFESILTMEFPETLQHLYLNDIRNHILKREIITTNLSNKMINEMGISFPFRLQNETGASISDIATAYYLATLIFKTDEITKKVESLDGKIPVELQYELLHSERVLLNMACRWFLQRRRIHTNLNEVFDYYHSSIDQLRKLIPGMIRGSTKEYVSRLKNKFKEHLLDEGIAEQIALSRVLYTSLNISDVASIHNFDLEKTAQLYFNIGASFNLVWFRDLLASDNISGKRANMARLSLRDDLDILQRRLTIVISQSDPAEKDIDKLLSNWINDHSSIYKRWELILKETKEYTPGDYTSLFIAIRELASMVDGSPKMERLSLLAYHDALTKLPNRFAVSDRIDHLQAKAERDQSKFAIHFIDLNKFKSINDNYGHLVGDEVLLEVTNRLNISIRSGDTVARLAGDEFLVIQTGVRSESDVLHMAKILLSIISKPMYLKEHRLNITASIGTAIYPAHGKNTMELVANADKAMYKSKINGLNKAILFESDVADKTN